MYSVSEHSWSIEGCIHSKRNRLSQKLVERLLHTNINLVLKESFFCPSLFITVGRRTGHRSPKPSPRVVRQFDCSVYGYVLNRPRHTHERERERERERKRERERGNADAQTVSTDGRAMLYANGQAHMFERKIVIKKQGGVLNRKKKPSIFFFSYLKRYSNTYTFLHSPTSVQW